MLYTSCYHEGLDRAVVKHADLGGSILLDADLRRSWLDRRTYMQGTRLEGANLDSVTGLTLVKIEKASSCDNKTVFPEGFREKLTVSERAYQELEECTNGNSQTGNSHVGQSLARCLRKIVHLRCCPSSKSTIKLDKYLQVIYTPELVQSSRSHGTIAVRWHLSNCLVLECFLQKPPIGHSCNHPRSITGRPAVLFGMV